MTKLARAFSTFSLVALLAAAAYLFYDGYRPPAPTNVPLSATVDRILIEKTARRMTVFSGNEPTKSYDIALGFAPDGDKERQGDGRTPEGLYTIDRRNPQSAFHLSLGINYPLPEDIARAREGGYSPGGDIMIHGQPNGSARTLAIGYDWTEGCIAVSNAEIEELWAHVKIGTEVEIRP